MSIKRKLAQLLHDTDDEFADGDPVVWDATRRGLRKGGASGSAPSILWSQGSVFNVASVADPAAAGTLVPFTEVEGHGELADVEISAGKLALPPGIYDGYMNVMFNGATPDTGRRYARVELDNWEGYAGPPRLEVAAVDVVSTLDMALFFTITDSESYETDKIFVKAAQSSGVAAHLGFTMFLRWAAYPEGWNR